MSNLKDINPFTAPDWMWTTMSLTAATADAGITVPEAYAQVGDVYRAIGIRANTVAKMPRHFYTLKGGEEVESDDRRLAGVAHLTDLLWRFEASLICSGAAYAAKLDAQTKQMRYFIAQSISLDIDPRVGLTGFRRNSVPMTPAQLLYIWLPSPHAEIGPGVGALQVALIDAGVERNMAQSLSAYFERGMVPPLVVYVESEGGIATPLTSDQRNELKAYLKQIVERAKRVLNPEVMGRKLGKIDLSSPLKDALPPDLPANVSKTIVKDLGVPYSLIFSDAANYATAQQDWRNLYDLTVVPDCELIQATMNEQYFNALGLELYFAPEELEVYQEDESQRATSLSSLINSGMPADVAYETLGYDLDEEDEARIRLAALQKEGATYEAACEYILEDADQNEVERVRRVLELFAPAPKPEPVASPIEIATPEPKQLPPPESMPVESDDDEVIESPMKADLLRYQRKALKRVKDGKPASCEFESKHIPASLLGAIRGALDAAESVDGVKGAFRQALVWGDYVAPVANNA